MKIEKQKLEEFVKNSLSKADVLRKLDVRPSGGNYKGLDSKLLEYNIDTTHFTGAAWNVGLRYKNFNPVKDINEILIENSTYSSSSSLKRRLYKENLKIPKCEICNITEWNNIPISFELDHINGINNDNRIENLRIICPNCHSQTSTYRGRNVNSSGILNNRNNNFLNKDSLYEEKEKVNKIVKEKKIRKTNNKYGTPLDYQNAVKNQWIESQYEYIDILKKSDIEFDKFGWVNKVAILLNKKPQHINKWMKKIMPEFYEKNCFKRYRVE